MLCRRRPSRGPPSQVEVGEAAEGGLIDKRKRKINKSFWPLHVTQTDRRSTLWGEEKKTSVEFYRIYRDVILYHFGAPPPLRLVHENRYRIWCLFSFLVSLSLSTYLVWRLVHTLMARHPIAETARFFSHFFFFRHQSNALFISLFPSIFFFFLHHNLPVCIFRLCWLGSFSTCSHTRALDKTRWENDALLFMEDGGIITHWPGMASISTQKFPPFYLFLSLVYLYTTIFLFHQGKRGVDFFFQMITDHKIKKSYLFF